MMSYLQTHYHFKLDFQIVDQHTEGKSVEYPSRKSKQGIKEWEGNIFNPIIKENVKGQKHPGRCVVAEPEQYIYWKPNL